MFPIYSLYVFNQYESGFQENNATFNYGYLK